VFFGPPSNAHGLKTKFGLTYYQRAYPLQCRIQGIRLYVILPILWSQRSTMHCHHTKDYSHTRMKNSFKTNHFHKPRASEANCCCCSCCSRISSVKHGVLTLKLIVTVVRETKYNVFFLWGLDPMRTMISSLMRFLDHTQRRIQSVELLWTNNQLVAETSILQHTTLAGQKFMPAGGIRNHNLSNRAAADL
jgi:hypothetical protein